MGHVGIHPPNPCMKRFNTPLALDARPPAGMLWKLRIPALHDGLAAILMFGIGFSPITALALSLMGVFTLPVASLLLVIPALGIATALSCHQPGHRRLMLRGYLMGIIAVTCYDGVRIPFIHAGWMDDFIPKIGGMLVGDGQPHPVLGYLWRYLGNGGGMGMAFVCAHSLLKHRLTEHQQARITPWLTKCIGLGFGCLVWACLILTLQISPQGEEMMFVITPTSLLLSWIGHLVFGCTLGCLVNRRTGWSPQA